MGKTATLTDAGAFEGMAAISYCLSSTICLRFSSPGAGTWAGLGADKKKKKNEAAGKRPKVICLSKCLVIKSFSDCGYCICPFTIKIGQRR